MTRTVALLVGMTIVASCGDYIGDDVRAGDYPRRDVVVFGETVDGTGDQVVEPEPSDPAQLGPGTCFEDLEDAPLRSFPAREPVGVVPCGQPHRYELFAVVPLEARPGEPWPGPEVAAERADLRCLDEFEAFVEVTWAESGFDYFALAPDQERWELGDTIASCALFDLGLVPLEGSMQGTGW